MSKNLYIRIAVWTIGFIVLVIIAKFDGWVVLCGYVLGMISEDVVAYQEKEPTHAPS